MPKILFEKSRKPESIIYWGYKVFIDEKEVGELKSDEWSFQLEMLPGSYKLVIKHGWLISAPLFLSIESEDISVECGNNSRGLNSLRALLGREGVLFTTVIGQQSLQVQGYPDIESKVLQTLKVCAKISIFLLVSNSILVDFVFGVKSAFLGFTATICMFALASFFSKLRAKK